MCANTETNPLGGSNFFWNKSFIFPEKIGVDVVIKGSTGSQTIRFVIFVVLDTPK